MKLLPGQLARREIFVETPESETQEIRFYDHAAISASFLSDYRLSTQAHHTGPVFAVTDTFWQAARPDDIDPDDELSDAEYEAERAAHPGYARDPEVTYWSTREAAEAHAATTLDGAVAFDGSESEGGREVIARAVRRTAGAVEWVLGDGSVMWRRGAVVSVERAG